MPLPLNLGQEEKADGAYIRPQFSLGESLAATIQLSQFDTSTSAAKRHYDRVMADDGQILNKEALKDMYPEVDFEEEEMSAGLADYISRQHKKRKVLEQIAGGGPRFMGAGMVQFGAAMIPHVLDPLDLAAGLGIGSVFTKGAGIIKGAASAGKVMNALSRLEKVSPAIAKASRTRFARHTTEGLIANIGAEAALVAPANMLEYQDYKLSESMFAVAAGTVGFTGLRFGIPHAFNYIKRNPRVANQVESIARTHALNYDVVPNPSRLVEREVLLTNSDKMLDPVTAKAYQYEKIAETKGRIFYVGTRSGSAKDLEFNIKDLDNGNTFDLSDDINHANGLAANEGSRVNGEIRQAKISEDALVIDAENALDANIKKRVEEALDGANIKEVKDAPTLKDAIIKAHEAIEAEKLDAGFFDRLNRSLVSEGVDGYHYTGGKTLHPEHKDHNVVKMLNKKKIEIGDAVEPRKDFLPEIDIDKESKLAGEVLDKKKNGLFVRPGQDQRIEESKKLPEPVEAREAKGAIEQRRAIEDSVEDLRDNLKDLYDQTGRDFSELEKELAGIRAENKEIEDAMAFIKTCLVGGGN